MKRILMIACVALLTAASSAVAGHHSNGKKAKGSSSVAVTDSIVCERNEANLVSDVYAWIAVAEPASLDDLSWRIENDGQLVDSGDDFGILCTVPFSGGTLYLVTLDDLDTGLLGSKPNGKPESYTLEINIDTGSGIASYGSDAFRWNG